MNWPLVLWFGRWAAKPVDRPTSSRPSPVTIHDLLRDFMAAELGEDGHRRVPCLACCLPQDKTRRWLAYRPDDGYLYDHLAYHLDPACRP